MLNIINSLNYFIDASFFWGSDSKDVESDFNSSVNVAHLIPDNIREFDLYSSLSYPFFHGSLVYSDNRNSSAVRNMVDMPIVYGKVVFAALNGSDVPGSKNHPEPVDGEKFEEMVLVTGIDTVDDGKSEFVMVKIHFVSIDYLKFISNMKDISTFSGFDTSTKPVCDVISEMFASVGLGDALDKESLTLTTQIPYVSSENDTLLTALDYVYRKIFDHDFKEHDGKTYCRIVYDFNSHKYVLWKFEDVGTEDSVDTGIKNVYIKSRREIVAADANVGSGSTGRSTRVYMKHSGDQSILFESLGNVKFVDYDYNKNEFTQSEKEKNDKSFVEHDDENDSEVKSKNSIVLGNAMIFKDNSYQRTFTTSRQNGSVYDTFSKSIFDTSFLRVESEGSIGRRAGNSIALTFVDPQKTIYETIAGDYLVTAVNSHYETDGSKTSFKTMMDIYRPYCKMDMYKDKMII